MQKELLGVVVWQEGDPNVFVGIGENKALLQSKGQVVVV